jgi:hypothetical protein
MKLPHITSWCLCLSTALRRVVSWIVSYASGRPIGSTCKGKAWHRETPATIYYYTSPNTLEERIPKPHRNGILQSRVLGALLRGCGTGYFTLRLRVFLDRVIMFMFRPNREVTGGPRIWHEEEVENSAFHRKTLEWTNIRRWSVYARNVHKRYEKCIRNFHWKTWREERILNVSEQTGGYR